MVDLYCKALSLENKMWVEGYYVKLLTEKNEKIEETHIVLKNLDKSWEIDPETICLFTGKYDCTLWEELSLEEQTMFLGEWNTEHNRHNEFYDWRGKRIFDNDILLTAGSLMHIFLDKESFALKVNEYSLHLYDSLTEEEKMIIRECGFESFKTTIDTEDIVYFALCNTFSGVLSGICRVVGNYLHTPELLTKEFYENNTDYIEKFRFDIK